MELINDKLYAEIKELLGVIPIDFGGGCSFEKGYLLAWLIANFNLKSSVDIGVYRGRSLFPQAIAHTRFSKGTVYGVDPWDNELAREKDNVQLKEAIDDFLDKVDLNTIGDDVNRLNIERGYAGHCILVRQKAEDAVSQFRERNTRFGLVHIDGNHDNAMVMKDIELYLPLLADKGFVVMDDISWDSVQLALNTVLGRYKLIYKKTDPKNDYAIFWKNDNHDEVAELIAALDEIGQKFELTDLREYLSEQKSRNATLNSQLQEQIAGNVYLNSQLQEQVATNIYLNNNLQEQANLNISLSTKLDGLNSQLREQAAHNLSLQSALDEVTHSRAYAVNVMLGKIRRLFIQ